MMTDPQKKLEEIRARAEAATEGPWKALTSGPANGDHWYVCDDGERIAMIHASDGLDEDSREPDAEFIAHAREDIPWLLDRITNLESAHAVLDQNLMAKAWQEGYRAGNDDWPSCALACGACDECQSEITFNPYRPQP